jgi:hypothetical protein
MCPTRQRQNARRCARRSAERNAIENTFCVLVRDSDLYSIIVSNKGFGIV